MQEFWASQERYGNFWQNQGSEIHEQNGIEKEKVGGKPVNVEFPLSDFSFGLIQYKSCNSYSKKDHTSKRPRFKKTKMQKHFWGSPNLRMSWPSFPDFKNHSAVLKFVFRRSAFPAKVPSSVLSQVASGAEQICILLAKGMLVELSKSKPKHYEIKLRSLWLL